MCCGLTDPRLEPLFENVIEMAKQLQELGFVYSNGEILIVEDEEKVGINT